jgi:hypothetical protein
MRNIFSFLTGESGQTTILSALSLMAVSSFIGLAIDSGHLELSKRQLQNAADSAAMAGGLEIRICGTQVDCPAMRNAVQAALSENGYTDGALVTNCAASSAPLTVSLNTPPCALGTKDPNRGKSGFVEVLLSQDVPTYFMEIFGKKSFRMSARAETARDPGGPCIYALDPTASGALSVLAGLGINSQCGIVVESNSPSAVTCLIGLGISAPSMKVHGGTAGLLCPTPANLQTNAPVPAPADPLSYLPKPAVGACGSHSGNTYWGSTSAVNILLGGNYVFNPGVYCGGISITAAILSNITFNPGTYILTTGPGLLGIPSGGLNMTISLLSSIQGQGVTFYNYGPFGGISITAASALGLSNFSLTAPTSGLYSGILFMQDPGNTTSGVFLASLLSGSKLEGAIYLPNASMTYAVGAVSSAYTILVAQTIQMNVGVLSQFGNDYSSLSTGSPLNGDRAVLVQ